MVSGNVNAKAELPHLTLAPDLAAVQLDELPMVTQPRASTTRELVLRRADQRCDRLTRVTQSLYSTERLNI
jgi:hypothetical protein